MTSPPTADFHALSRNVKKIHTQISWADHSSYDKGPREWMILGEIMLREISGGSRNGGIWQLSAYLLNATDPEHDAAKLFSLELIGVKFTSVEYGQTSFEGWIKPDDSGAFRVGPLDYNPLKHKNTEKCDGKKWCKRGEPHVIVPEGFYVPPENPDLFNLVRGRRIEVTTGIINKDNDQ